MSIALFTLTSKTLVRRPPLPSSHDDWTRHFSGFQHSAFVLRAEGRLEHSPNARKPIPRGQLVELLSKALLYTEVESHWKGNAMTTNCKGTFSLIDEHVCTIDPSLPATTTFNPPPQPPLPEPTPVLQTNGTTEMRKASTPASEVAPKGKRARTADMDVDSSASTAARTNLAFVRNPLS